MSDSAYENICIFHILDGLRDGLSHFSGPSRVALIYAIAPGAPLRIYDPQDLLEGHELRLREYYLESDAWKKNLVATDRLNLPVFTDDPSLQLAGLIAFGGSAPAFCYQMWFTEHHPDICSIGPTKRWLENAVVLLVQDMAASNILRIGTSGYVLQTYATHAVRDCIVDERARRMGLDTHLRIFPILDAILAISKTPEEGLWPRGQLVFVEPRDIERINFLTRFPAMQQPLLQNHKHVRKLLQAVEQSTRVLISDGASIIGIARGRMPDFRVVADFRGGYGFLRMDNDLIASFYDGGFHSSNRRANLVQVEEMLLELDMDQTRRYALFKVISALVNSARDRKHGCTLVIDPNTPPIPLSGQSLEVPLNLGKDHILDLAKSLAKVDGALHISTDLHLQGFACLLDGPRVPGENNARGARFNSALRFTSLHSRLIVIVVSSDRPVSIIQNGVELNARCEWRTTSACSATPPVLNDWLEQAGV
jgi:hypothetical protein